MKFKEISEEYLAAVVEKFPEWMADNYPFVMNKYNHEWMIANRIEWMAEFAPGLFKGEEEAELLFQLSPRSACILFDKFCAFEHPEVTAKEEPMLLARHNPKWVRENRPYIFYEFIEEQKSYKCRYKEFKNEKRKENRNLEFVIARAKKMFGEYYRDWMVISKYSVWLASFQPEWLADNYPRVMVFVRHKWMVEHRNEWMWKNYWFSMMNEFPSKAKTCLPEYVKKGNYGNQSPQHTINGLINKYYGEDISKKDDIPKEVEEFIKDIAV
jgi:hypothetical protein